MLHQSTLDLVGEPFGRLTVRAVRQWQGEAFALCECACGARKMVRVNALTKDHTGSCGCLRAEKIGILGRAGRSSASGGVAIGSMRAKTPMRARILAGLRREVMNARAMDDPERARDAERMLESMGAEVPR